MLGPMNTQLVLDHTSGITGQIGALSNNISQQRLQEAQLAQQAQSSNRFANVQEGQLALSQRKYQDEQQMLQKQQEQQQQMQLALKEAAKQGVEGIKQFYISNGMAEQALSLEKSQAEIKKLELDRVKVFSDINKTENALAKAEAMRQIVAASDSPQAQKWLYDNMRAQLKKEGVELPEKPTQELLLAMSEEATKVQRTAAAVVSNPDLRRQYGESITQVYGPEGQQRIQQQADSYITPQGTHITDLQRRTQSAVSGMSDADLDRKHPWATNPEATMREILFPTQRGFNPEDADLRFVNQTGKNTQDPNQRMTPSELAQTQAELQPQTSSRKVAGKDEKEELRDFLKQNNLNDKLLDNLKPEVITQLRVNAGLVNKSDLSDAQYEAAYGKEALKTKKEADKLQQEADSLELENQQASEEAFRQSIRRGLPTTLEGVMPLNQATGLPTEKPKVQDEISETADRFLDVLNSRTSSESEKSAAISALSRLQENKAKRKDEFELQRLKNENALEVANIKAKGKANKNILENGNMALTSKVQSDQMDKATKIQAMMLRTDNIMESYDPRALTYLGKSQTYIAEQLDKLGLSSSQQKNLIENVEAFRTELEGTFAAFMKDISGATVSDREVIRLKKAMLNSDISPEQMNARYTTLKKAMQLELEYRNYLLKNGYSPELPEEFKARKSEISNEINSYTSNSNTSSTRAEIMGMLDD